jgi:hypothetical protein
MALYSVENDHEVISSNLELMLVKEWLDVFAFPVRWQESGLPSAWNLSSFSTFKRAIERLDPRTFDFLFGSTGVPLLTQMDHLFTVEHRCNWGPPLGHADSQPSVQCQQINCARCFGGRGGFRFNWVGPWTCTKAVNNSDRFEDVTREWIKCSSDKACQSCACMGFLLSSVMDTADIDRSPEGFSSHDLDQLNP